MDHELQAQSYGPTATAVQATLAGTISDSQVAVGNGNMQVSTGGGDCIVNQAVHTPPRPREEIRVLPRIQPSLLGRDDEVALALDTIADRQPVQFHGERGVGKTALLRHLAHATAGVSPEGHVYFRAANTSLDDLLQTLFDFLFECEVPTKRTRGQLASDLAGWEVLFLLDDVGLDEDDLQTLLDTVPLSTFVMSSAERTLWDGEAAELRGLSEGAALALFESRLRRPLSNGGRASFRARWQELAGNPQQLVKDAEALRAASRRAAATPASAAELTSGDRDLLKLTAALDGVPLGNTALAELSDQPDAAARLSSLEDRGLTQSHSPRYSATAPGAPLIGESELFALRLRLLAYFIDRAERGDIESDRPRDDLDPIVALLRWGQTAAPHADVLRLARASDTIAAGAGMWDAWRTILDIGLASARAIGDRAGEAWALHQLGTRALCLEDAFGAGRLLREALELRLRLGDRAGAANTRHNMRFLPGGGGGHGGQKDVPPRGPGRGPGTPSGGGLGGSGVSLLAPSSWPLLWALVPVIVLAAIGAGAAVLGSAPQALDASVIDGRALLPGVATADWCAGIGGCTGPVACTPKASCPRPARHPADEPVHAGAGPRDHAGRRRLVVTPLQAVSASGGQVGDDEPVSWKAVPRMPVRPVSTHDGPVPPTDDGPRDDPSSDDGQGIVDPVLDPVGDVIDSAEDVADDLAAIDAPTGGSSTVDKAGCDHHAAIRTFIQQELGLPAELASLDLARIVHGQVQHVRDLLAGLCGLAVVADLVDFLLTPLAR